MRDSPAVGRRPSRARGARRARPRAAARAPPPAACAACDRERRGDADVVQRALVVVEPEQQRADQRAGALLVPAEAGDHAVGGAHVLHLEHRALARLVGGVARLGDHAVEAGALEAVEPVARRPRGRACRASGARGGAASRAPPRAARGAPPAAAPRRSSSPAASRSKATNDAGVSAASFVDPRRRRVQAQLQRVEVEAARRRDHDLAVDHAARAAALRRSACVRARGSSGRAASGRGSGCRASSPSRKTMRAKAVPLGLEEPALALGQRARRASPASARPAARSET